MIGIFTGNPYRMAFHPPYRRNARHIDNCIHRPEICITRKCRTPDTPFGSRGCGFQDLGLFCFPYLLFSRAHTPARPTSLTNDLSFRKRGVTMPYMIQIECDQNRSQRRLPRPRCSKGVLHGQVGSALL